MARPYITAGDVSFTCNLNGSRVQGRSVAATLPFASNQTSMWGVYRLYGFLAAAGREQDGERAVAQALRSWKFLPQWEAQQRPHQAPTLREIITLSSATGSWLQRE